MGECGQGAERACHQSPLCAVLPTLVTTLRPASQVKYLSSSPGNQGSLVFQDLLEWPRKLYWAVVFTLAWPPVIEERAKRDPGTCLLRPGSASEPVWDQDGPLSWNRATFTPHLRHSPTRELLCCQELSCSQGSHFLRGNVAQCGL